MRIVLDTSILVRANERSSGLARDLLLTILGSEHTLLLSNEMLFELARVLRYPRLESVYKLSEQEVYGYVTFLRDSAEIVTVNAVVKAPIRDVDDIAVMQTAIIEKADILCTRDDDFFELPAGEYLSEIGIIVMDNITLMKQLDS